MSIGLYDIDFMTYTYIPFNLDLMKISTYYKQKKEIVVLAPQLEPERYQQMFVVKDYDDENFDRHILQPNVHYRGHAFSHENYIPLKEEVEIVRPDKYLYYKFKDKFCINKTKTLLFKELINAEHIRLSLDGTSLWENYNKNIQLTGKTKCLIFHDYNLENIKDSDLIIKDILNQIPNKSKHFIGMKFPIQIENEQQLKKWLQFSPMTKFFSLQYNGLMDDEFFNEFLIKSKSIAMKFYYNIASKKHTNQKDFISKDLYKIYKQILLARNLGISIILKYDDYFFKDKRWERLIKLINLYGNFSINTIDMKKHPNYNNYNNDFTLFRYITTKKFFFGVNSKNFTLEELRDLFQMVREQNYEVFKMFYESCKVEFKGGKIIDKFRD